jgi:hypothetical protein
MGDRASQSWDAVNPERRGEGRLSVCSRFQKVSPAARLMREHVDNIVERFTGLMVGG